MVYLPHYPDAPQVAQVLGASFGKSVDSLSGHDFCRCRASRRRLPSQDGCYSNLESRSHPALRLPDLPIAPGSRCHGFPRLGNFFFLFRRRCGRRRRQLSIGDHDPISDDRGAREDQQNFKCSRPFTQRPLPRTFMFMPSTDYSSRIRRSAQKSLQRDFRRG